MPRAGDQSSEGCAVRQSSCPRALTRSHGKYRHVPSFQSGRKTAGTRDRPPGQRLNGNGPPASGSQRPRLSALKLGIAGAIEAEPPFLRRAVAHGRRDGDLRERPYDLAEPPSSQAGPQEKGARGGVVGAEGSFVGQDNCGFHVSALNPLDGHKVEAERAGARDERADVMVGFRPIGAAAELQNVLRCVHRRHMDLLDEVTLDALDRGRGRKVHFLRQLIEVQRHFDLMATMHVDALFVADSGLTQNRIEFERRVTVQPKNESLGAMVIREPYITSGDDDLANGRVLIDFDEFDAAIPFDLEKKAGWSA